jgi:hypothetical protein
MVSPAYVGGKRGGRRALVVIENADSPGKISASGIGTKLDWTLHDRHPLRAGRREAGTPMRTPRTQGRTSALGRGRLCPRR